MDFMDKCIEELEQHMHRRIEMHIESTILFMTKELRPDLNPEAVLSDLKNKAKDYVASVLSPDEQKSSQSQSPQNPPSLRVL